MPTKSEPDRLTLASVGDVPPTPEERAQAHREREQALHNPDRYYAAVHAAFTSQRRKSRSGAAQVARPQPRRRGAGRPAARRTGASSSTSSSDPGKGDGDGDPPDGRRQLRLVVADGDPAPGDAAVRRAFERIANEQQPGRRWTVRP